MRNPYPLAVILSLSLCLAHSFAAQAQITGGRQVFQFLSLSPSARATALGGSQIAVRDEDLSLAAQNPAALNPLMDGRLSFQHNFFLADIQHGYAAYAQHLPKWGFTVHGGVQYLNYGEIRQTDMLGTLIGGEVKASETALTLGAARPLSERLSLGLSLRAGFSALAEYRASALAADAGLLYADTARRFSLAVVLRNAGTQLSTYAGQREDLPFDLQVGFSKRLRHLPFRISVIAHHLYDWDIRYNDPNAEDDQVLLFGEDQPQENKGQAWVDNFFRHLIFNGEFLLGRNEVVRIRLGYNHLRKRELSVRNYRSLAGFSGGMGIKISRFRLDMGYGAYHLAGGVFHVGIGTNLKDFF
ncbi:MAG TPA: type IX secretion system protein PorQ [Saprospiraceae bacterium]|nr:type IX secretion system protein PorQ [Saprospiraceae bacterium]HND89721.1 type IX secretion system protein PorQ [Saprospiraceae bacterium]